MQNTETDTCTHSQRCKDTSTQRHMDTQTQKHAHIHTHTHTDTHAHTHIHTLKLKWGQSYFKWCQLAEHSIDHSAVKKKWLINSYQHPCMIVWQEHEWSYLHMLKWNGTRISFIRLMHHGDIPHFSLMHWQVCEKHWLMVQPIKQKLK